MRDGATITPADDGPYHLKGDFTIVMPSGRELRTEGDAWLCRCGGSENKPFCDGTHRRIGFKAAEVQETAAAPSRESLPAGDWVAVADAAAIGENELLGVEVGGQALVLGRVGGALYAIGGTCSHRHGRLADGELEGEVVVCPLHGGGFDIRTGEARCLPAVEPVPRYAVKIEDGRVLVSRAPSPAEVGS